MKCTKKPFLFLMPKPSSEVSPSFGGFSPSHLFSSLHQKLLTISLFGFQSMPIPSQKKKKQAGNLPLFLMKTGKGIKTLMVTRPHQKILLLNNYCTSTSINCPLLVLRIWRRSPQITHTVSEAPLPPVRSELGEGSQGEAGYAESALRRYWRRTGCGVIPHT